MLGTFVFDFGLAHAIWTETFFISPCINIYLTHDFCYFPVLGQQSPVSSDAATTARASSIAGHNNNNIHSHESMGNINPVYDR